jgi:ABC-type uncharacterized transport system substrate-binding protein
MPNRLLPGMLAAFLLGGGSTLPAEAHPHIWITVEAVVVYDKGTFTGLSQKWTFDEYYSAMAVDGLDKNKDGVFDREELAELAKVNMEGLKDFAYFTFPVLAGQKLDLGEPGDYWLEHKEGRLALHFTLPFAKPVLIEAKGLAIAVRDPTFFIAFTPAKTDPVKLSAGAPKGCEAKIGEPGETPGAGSSPLEALQAQVGGRGGIGRAILVECAGP